MKFTLYEKPSGRAFGVIDCLPDHIDDKTNNGTYGYLEGEFLNHYFENALPVSYPLRPTPNHIFDYTTKQWEDPRTLQDLKNARWGSIKQARSQAEYAGFTWDGSTFDSDATSQQRITGAVTLAKLSSEFVIGWTLQDNSVRVLNQLDMLNVGMELGFHVATQFTKAQALRGQIEAASTAGEVDAVRW